jgi:tellurite resistance protein TerA
MIRLEKAGDRARLELRKAPSVAQTDRRIHITLRWRAAVDLDLHAFAVGPQGAVEHVYFGNRGSDNSAPFMTLDKDAGVGNTAGANEENLVVHDLRPYTRVVFCANIFRFIGFLSRGDNFGKYDGAVRVRALGENFEVPLTSTEVGKWAVIAAIDNRGESPELININRVLKSEPTPTELLSF